MDWWKPKCEQCNNIRITMRKLIMWLMTFISDGDKLIIADMLLTDVLKSKKATIDNVYAEKIITTVIKSQGNKIQEFIVKD